MTASTAVPGASCHPDDAAPIVIHSFADGDRSARVRWTASEIGVPYREVRVVPGEHLKHRFHELNPLGRVPVLTSGPVTIAESGAICLWLAETYGRQSRLIPPEQHADRPRFLFWYFAACSTLESAYFAFHFAADTDPELPKLRTAASSMLTRVEHALSVHEHIAGEHFTLADVMLGYLVALAIRKGLLERHPILDRYAQRLASRPAVRPLGLFA